MNTISEICADLRKGKLIVLVDSRDRENEGDLVCAAAHVKPAYITFMATHGHGLICVPITEERQNQLQLPLIPKRHTTKLQNCNFTVSVDARSHITSGISAYDRAKTIKLLADSRAKPEDFSQPGHVFPLVGASGGVLSRPGHTEGTLDLLRLAGLTQVGVICEIMGNDGKMLHGKALTNFAKKHKLKILDIQSIVSHRLRTEKIVKRAVETRLPTAYGMFRAIVYTTTIDSKEHVALVMNSKKGYAHSRGKLVRVHSECLTGDLFHSTRCDCHNQLNSALMAISRENDGVLVYLRQEGRGIGLINKLKAYNLQDKGYDTVEANVALGFEADLRQYGIAAQILSDLGLKKIRLMTNNPKKISELKYNGLRVVERVREHRYLRDKKFNLGHLLSHV